MLCTAYFYEDDVSSFPNEETALWGDSSLGLAVLESVLSALQDDPGVCEAPGPRPRPLPAHIIGIGTVWLHNAHLCIFLLQENGTDQDKVFNCGWREMTLLSLSG